MKNKVRFSLTTRILLIYLVVATFLFSGVTISRFITIATGEDTARVAGLNMELDPVFEAKNFVPGSEQTFTFYVLTDYPSYDQTYNINILTSGNIPILQYKLTCTIDNGTHVDLADYKSLQEINELSKNGMLPKYKDTVHTYTLHVFMPDGADAIYSSEIELITVSVSSEQIG